MSPIDTVTSSHPLAPCSFMMVCMFCVSRNTSTILYWNRFGSCALAENGWLAINAMANADRLIPAIPHTTEKRMSFMAHLALSLSFTHDSVAAEIILAARRTTTGQDSRAALDIGGGPNYLPSHTH